MSEASTAYYVADTAGVSVRTVSRDLSDPTCVSKKTSALIVQAMQALQFQPSKAARALKGDKPNLIGVVSDGITVSPDSFELIVAAHCHRPVARTIWTGLWAPAWSI